MDRLSVAIVAITTVLAWSMTTHLLPPTWRGALATIVVGVVFAYPLRGPLGFSTKNYLRFGALLIVVVPLVHLALADLAEARMWVTLTIVLFAAAGLVLNQARRRHRA